MCRRQRVQRLPSEMGDVVVCRFAILPVPCHEFLHEHCFDDFITNRNESSAADITRRSSGSVNGSAWRPSAAILQTTTQKKDVWWLLGRSHAKTLSHRLQPRILWWRNLEIQDITIHREGQNGQTQEMSRKPKSCIHAPMLYKIQGIPQASSPVLLADERLHYTCSPYRPFLMSSAIFSASM